MITRFRVEAKGGSKELVENDLADFATETQNRLNKKNVWNQDRNLWECTQDVIVGKPGHYEGRQVWVYRGSK